MKQSWRGFTLIEILIAVVIILILTLGGIKITSAYLNQHHWDRLFNRLERQFLDINVYALAGFSAAYAEAGDDVAVLPEAYHLYLEGDEPSGAWYIESRQREGSSDPLQRTISYQEYVDFEADRITMVEAVLREGPDPESGPRTSASHVLMTWSHPFSQLSFGLLAAPLARSSEVLNRDFAMPAEVPGCQDFPKICTLTLSYQQEATTDRRDIIFDLQKGVYHDHF